MSAPVLMTSLPEAKRGGTLSREPSSRHRSLMNRSYVAALELRIEKLEKRLKFAQNRKASVSNHINDEAAPPADRKDSLANIRAAIHRKAARSREESDVNALVSDFGFL